MRIIICVLLFVISLTAEAQQPTLTITDIDSLRYPARNTVLTIIAHRQYVDHQLQQLHLREILTIYARLDALIQELQILNRQQANLALIHRLNIEKQKHSEIADIEVLLSEQNLLGKQQAIVNQKFQIRETILTLTRLANIPIIISPHTSKEQ
jgi:hypothetical protein